MILGKSQHSYAIINIHNVLYHIHRQIATISPAEFNHCKSDKESFSMLMALLIGDCIEREIQKSEGEIDLDLLLMCDKLLEVLYPSEPLTEEEVSKRVQRIKQQADQEE